MIRNSPLKQTFSRSDKGQDFICFNTFAQIFRMSEVRVRYAPSPTGPQHIGGIRTALYNYLFAKKNGGKIILRIEDTDQTRYVPGTEDYLIESIKWCGFDFDEGVHVGGEYGPYRQSERKELYKPYAQQLVKSGHAYYAFDTPEELEEMRERLKKTGNPSPQYNAAVRTYMKNSLTLSEDEVQKRLDAGEEYVIRIKMPRNEEIKVHDIIRGWVVVNSNQLDDKVLFKSDGMPTYHLANVVDDHLMKISHVIRGEEWLPSAPLHVILYRFLGWEDTMPEFAHLPLLLKPDGNGKLSKRDGDRLGFPVFPLDWTDPNTGEKSSGYREAGYFPEAFLNILAFLGWNPGDTREHFTLDELIEAFSLERVGKSGAKFDPDKAKWYNQHYLRLKSNEELAKIFIPYLQEAGYTGFSEEYVAQTCELLKERASFVKEMLEEGAFFFAAPTEFDQITKEKKWKDDSAEILQKLSAEFKNTAFQADKLEEVFKVFLEKEGKSIGQVLPCLRLTITGKGIGPSMFHIMQILGKEESLKRIANGIQQLNG